MDIDSLFIFALVIYTCWLHARVSGIKKHINKALDTIGDKLLVTTKELHSLGNKTLVKRVDKLIDSLNNDFGEVVTKIQNDVKELKNKE